MGRKSHITLLASTCSLLENGHSKDALANCESVLEDEASSPYERWVAYSLGTIAARQLGDWGKRTHYENEAAGIQIRTPELLDEYNVHRALTLKTAELTRRYVTANFVEANQEALEMANRGAELAMAGQSQAAGRLLRRAVELDPKCELAHFNLGLYAYHALRDFQLCAQCMRKVLELNPHNEGAKQALNVLRSEGHLA